MTIVLYTNSLSAHQLPLATELLKIVGDRSFRYIYTNERLQGGAQEVRIDEPWIVKESKSRVEVEEWKENCDLLIVGGIRPIDLMERRLAAGKATFYMAERWFKPFLINVTIPFFNLHSELQLPGWLRLLHPRYFKMARRFVGLFSHDAFRYLSIGFWSKYDMLRLCRFFGVKNANGKMIDWGYFVAPSEIGHREHVEHRDEIKILWVGRMLRLKHVETIIKAVALANKKMNHSTISNSSFSVPNFSLTLVGDGPEKTYLQKLANSIVDLDLQPRPLSFLPPVSLSEVRQVMRDHDLYIFSSNGFDGWGAVVPEAMTEGMTVLGTYEAGASSTLLPKENLFHCGDWKNLSKMLSDKTYRKSDMPIEYTLQLSTERLLSHYKQCRGTNEN